MDKKRNKKRMILLPLCLIFIFSFLGFLVITGKKSREALPERSEAEIAYYRKHKVLSKIVDQFFDQSVMRYGVIPISEGIGCYREIDLKSLTFQLNSSYQEETLRQLAIDLTEDFLELLNSNDEIKKWARYSEFNIYNIDLTLMIPKDPYFSSIWCKKGKLYFLLKEEISPYNNKMWIEPYREAFVKVYPDRESKYWGTGEEIDNQTLKKTAMAPMLENLLNKVEKKVLPLGYLLADGNFAYTAGFQRNRTSLKEIYVALEPFDPVLNKWSLIDVDVAREEYFKLADLVLDCINDNKEIRPYLANYPVTWNQLYFVIDACNYKSKSNDVIEVFRLQNNLFYRNKDHKKLFKIESVEEGRELLKKSTGCSL
jgi:hypothetical protein